MHAYKYKILQNTNKTHPQRMINAKKKHFDLRIRYKQYLGRETRGNLNDWNLLGLLQIMCILNIYPKTKTCSVQHYSRKQKLISSKNYIKIDTVVINIHGPMNRK